VIDVSIKENKVISRRWIEEIWQKAASIDELLSEDFSFNYASSGTEPNRETYEDFVKIYLERFPDIKFSVEDVVSEGDKVAVYWKGEGTHKGEFWGVAPTGKKVKVAGISILQIKNGKIVKEWGYQNNLDFMQQLGAIPQQQ